MYVFMRVLIDMVHQWVCKQRLQTLSLVPLSLLWEVESRTDNLEEECMRCIRCEVYEMYDMWDVWTFDGGCFIAWHIEVMMFIQTTITSTLKGQTLPFESNCIAWSTFNIQADIWSMSPITMLDGLCFRKGIVTAGEHWAMPGQQQGCPKPLAGKVFYLDLPSNRRAEALESDLKLLGGVRDRRTG